MESSILSEVDDTSILRTGLPTPLCLSSQLATGLSPRAPRSGLERSDFVLRRTSPVAGRPGEGLLTEPTTAVQPWPREHVVMPPIRSFVPFGQAGSPCPIVTAE